MVGVACVVLAVALLALPAALAYDPWAWLVWGREITSLDLDTVGGPSWKPLPVLVTAPLALFGDAAPTLWLVFARVAGLLAILGVYRLATWLAGSFAGVLAVVALLLTPDPGPRFVRLVVEGHTAPIAAALAVWTIERHLAGKRGTAFALLTLLSFDRPEAWPFLVVYGCWISRTSPRLRALLVTGVGLVPVVWFGGDWWGSGSPLHGADSARVIADDVAIRTVDGLRRVGEVLIPPAWAAALFAMFDSWRRRDPTVLLLGAGALVWFALVVGMGAVLGYAALSRFLLPGAAVLCVLAGVGIVRAYEVLPAGSTRVVVVAAIVIVSVPLVALRAWGIDGELHEIAARARVIDDLDGAIAAAGGADAIAACRRVAVEHPGVPRVAAAWKLEVPLGEVAGRLGARRGATFVRRGRQPLVPGLAEPLRLVARSDGWDVYSRGCDRA